MAVRRLTVVLAFFAVLVPAAAAHAASIWTPINSGTADTISSIVYQSPTRFWYATTNGKIAHFNGSSFVTGTGITPGENFTDLAFQPGGLYGYAVASNGDVWQTANGGASWTRLATPTTLTDCLASATAEPVSELNAVVWANTSTVYLLGNGSTLEKATNANTATPTFTEINKNGSGTCRSQSESSSQNLTDATFLPANPLDGFMISQDFGSLYASSNGFASGVKKSEMINNFQGSPRLAQDPANPNRLWAVDHSPGGGGCGELCLQFSTDGGVTENHATFPNDGNPSVGLYDVSSQGGVEVAAGSGGEIFNSLDGSNFYLQPAEGALATENWRAEDAYDAAHAAVGGEGGALAVTAAANTIPDIVAPTGSISGPTTVSSGSPATYTASVVDNVGGSGISPTGYTWAVPGFPAQHGQAATYSFPRGTGAATITLTFTDNAGNHGTATLNVTVNDSPAKPPRLASAGFQPKTTTTGGATITIYRRVIVTGRSPRYVPVKVSAHQPRTIAVTILTVKGRHRVATTHLALKRHGRGTIRLAVKRGIKPGQYLIVVRVSTHKGRHVGRLISVKFKLV